jgi:Skp family chaperone for outer membrane proteins
MKSRKVLTAVLLGAAALTFLSYERGLAAARKEITPARIGVVSVNRILTNSKKHAQWQEKMAAEEQTARGEIDKLGKELEAVKADMATRKVGSNDYIKLMRQALNKEAAYEARKQSYDREMSLKVQLWTESLYRDVLAVVSTVAKEKGLDMIVAKEEVEFPSAGIRDLMLLIRTNKVLYHSEHMDITNEVLAVLDGIN